MGLFRRRKQVEAPSSGERLATIEPGVPGRCPRCDGFGYLDHLDLVDGYQLQHCRDCGNRWEYRFDADGHVLDLTEDVGREPFHVDLPDADALEAAIPTPHPRDRGPAPDPIATDAGTATEADDDPAVHDVVDLTGQVPGHVEATASAEPQPESAADWLRRTAAG